MHSLSRSSAQRVTAGALAILTVNAIRLPAQDKSPEQRAVAYLAAEVAAWQPQNHCFSCHNNGDGARALYLALTRSYRVPAESLAETTRWLSSPQNWTKGLSESPAGDPRLARVQF